MKIQILEKLNAKVLDEIYECIEPTSTGMGGASFWGINLKTQERVFIKFLIFPRSPMEMARFKNEIYAVEQLSKFPHNHIPKFYSRGSLYGEEILYFVTERVGGTPLSDWIDENLEESTLDERLEIFHRVVSAVSLAVGIYNHCDLHPGNIILLPDTPEWHGPKFDSKVKIVDWGNAFGAMLAQYDDSPDFIITLDNRFRKEIAGSFYCTPPEVFSSRVGDVHHWGKYDAWAMGLLFYKLLIGKNLLSFTGLGDYSSSISSKTIDQILDEAKLEIASLEHPAANILSETFRGLSDVIDSQRMSPSTAARILWDVRIEKLIISEPLDIKKYMANPHDFRPQNGWTFSAWPDYD